MSHPTTRRRRSWMARAALVAAGALLVSSCEFDGAYDLPLPGSPVDEDNSFEITADFADILNVVPRSPIMVNDVTVGEVTDVERVGWHAKVTMRVREDVVLPDNAIADIRQVSLLGEKYVALEPPPTIEPIGRLGAGDNIPLIMTGRNPEVEEVLGALSFLLSGGGVGQLATITQELNNAMSGRTGSLNSLLGSLESVVGTLDDQRADIINALESLNSLTATLNRERETITGALDVAGPAVEVLADQHDELIEMLSSLDRLGVVGTRVIGASKDDVVQTLRNLQPVLAKLNEAGDKLAPGLNLIVSFPFPKEASEIVKGDYANTSIRADIDLQNFFAPDGGVPDLPGLPDVPIPDVVDLVVKCLTSESITSKACTKVLGDLNLLPQLIRSCERPRNRDNPVCRALGPIRGGNGPLGGLQDLPGLSGLGRLSTALSSGEPSPSSSTQRLFGGGS